MKPRVEIVQGSLDWYLRIELRDETDVVTLVNVYPFKRLIEAIELASVLQIHIDNIDTLPLKQYAKGA